MVLRSGDAWRGRVRPPSGGGHVAFRGGRFDRPGVVLGRQNDVRTHLAVGAESFDEAFEVGKGCGSDLEHGAVFARQLVDFHDLGVVVGAGCA